MRFETGWPRRRLAFYPIWFAAWAIGTLLGVLMIPSEQGHGTHTQLGLPPCGSVVFFSRPCPACGLTTSITRLLEGDLIGSFEAHAFGLVLYATWTLTALASLVAFVRGVKLRDTGSLIGRLAIVGTAAFAIYGLARFALVTYPERYVVVPTATRENSPSSEP